MPLNPPTRRWPRHALDVALRIVQKVFTMVPPGLSPQGFGVATAFRLSWEPERYGLPAVAVVVPALDFQQPTQQQ